MIIDAAFSEAALAAAHHLVSTDRMHVCQRHANEHYSYTWCPKSFTKGGWCLEMWVGCLEIGPVSGILEGGREGSTELPRNNRELGGTRGCTIGRVWKSCGPGGSRGNMETQVG